MPEGYGLIRFEDRRDSGYLTMSEILNVAYVIVAVLLLFGAAVFVHEFGHFWMARRRGLKVEGFAIGFGPKIFSWTRDGIEYSWRWIPAGGFVKLPQMITSEALEGESSSGGEKVPPAPPLRRARRGAPGRRGAPVFRATRVRTGWRERKDFKA